MLSIQNYDQMNQMSNFKARNLPKAQKTLKTLYNKINLFFLHFSVPSDSYLLFSKSCLPKILAFTACFWCVSAHKV